MEWLISGQSEQVKADINPTSDDSKDQSVSCLVCCNLYMTIYPDIVRYIIFFHFSLVHVASTEFTKFKI